MLDMIGALLNEHKGELLGQLTGEANFDPQEAQRFLPPALGQIGEALGSGGLDVSKLLGGDGLGALLGQVDLGALAGQADVSEAKAKSGLAAIVPLVVSLLKNQEGGLEGLLGKLGGGDAAGTIGALAGKLFNR